jgi:hypothetical protein
METTAFFQLLLLLAAVMVEQTPLVALRQETQAVQVAAVQEVDQQRQAAELELQVKATQVALVEFKIMTQ